MMIVTNADIKASGELAVSPILSQNRESSSASSLEKDTFKGHETQDHARGITRGIDPSKHVATFETFGDPSYYTPIENYEGRHRYDPKFEWEPKEEKKLVRKVRTAIQSINKTQPKMSNPRSWICASAPGRASCSLPYNSIAATSPKPYPTTCSTTCT